MTARHSCSSLRARRLRGTVVAALAVLIATATAAPCRAEPTDERAIELVRPLGDVYNERTTDGDAYPGSLGIRAVLVRREFALTLEWRRNVYLTESAGAGSLTRYARIEGGFGTAPPFLARETSLEARLERRIARTVPIYAGAAALRTWPNYHYPSLNALGAGIELRAAALAGVRPFGSAFYYPVASGAYVTETAPARTLRPAFGILKLDAGFVIRSARSPLYFMIGYANEVRSGRSLPSDIRFIRSDPYAGAGVTL